MLATNVRKEDSGEYVTVKCFMECCIIFCGMFCAEIHFSNIMDHALFFLHRQYKMNKKT